jgi:hypothetical protein
MVHSDGAVDTDFTMHIGLQGGAGHIIEDDRHGHWYHEEPIPDADPHDIEPCQMLMQPTNLTIPTTLPAESHFVFGTTAGCQNPSAGGPACGEFLAGPGGTGMGIDGHWIPLGEPYWNLLLTSTIDQGGVNHDSDCVFTDASGTIIKTVIPPEPCTAQVPEGAEWVFVYPSFAVAVGMTVDFVFPPAP